MYKKLRLDIRYQVSCQCEKRADFVKLLKKHKPKKIIDAGYDVDDNGYLVPCEKEQSSLD